ncbi:MAG TPA: hypothetical protein VJT71_14780 [Pyrinomonadaceae bacterium]|nr:hypothetical protein [Pyrinomonadaceae bacterium]
MRLTTVLPAALSLVAFLVSGAAGPAQQQAVCVANAQRGTDLGEKINACDRVLGARVGEITVSPGGPIRTQVTISGGHTLRLRAGVYPSNFVDTGEDGIIRLRSGSRIVGAGQNATILEESSERAIVNGLLNHWTVIINYDGSLSNYAASRDIRVSDLQIRGAASAYNSAPPTIALGNCHNCSVERVTLDGTRSIGIQAGGGAEEGNLADGVVIRDCILRGVASQSLAVVNGANITLERNQIISPGANPSAEQARRLQNPPPGNVPIDLEPNSAKDTMKNIVIRGNVIDASDSPGLNTLNGIVIQNPTGIPAARFGPILVEGNRIIGARLSDTTNHIAATGIWISGAQATRVINNYIQRAYDGIRVSSALDFEISKNQLVSCGFTANSSMVLEGVLRGSIVDNVFTIGPGDALAEGNDTVIAMGHDQARSRVVIARNRQGR